MWCCGRGATLGSQEVEGVHNHDSQLDSDVIEADLFHQKQLKCYVLKILKIIHFLKVLSLPTYLLLSSIIIQLPSGGGRGWIKDG